VYRLDGFMVVSPRASVIPCRFCCFLCPEYLPTKQHTPSDFNDTASLCAGIATFVLEHLVSTHFAAPYAVDLYNWLKTVYGKDRAAEVRLLVIPGEQQKRYLQPYGRNSLPLEYPTSLADSPEAGRNQLRAPQPHYQPFERPA
jgi:hypothetical protein